MYISKLTNVSLEKLHITSTTKDREIIKTLQPGESVMNFFVPNLIELVMRALVAVVLPRGAKNRWNRFGGRI